jgi:DNA-binding LytR/AlgR family response regulator
MRIAICDDDNRDSSATKETIARFDSGLNCDVYSSAVDLLSAMNSIFYDLVFLDIEMDALNGYDAAKQIMARDDKPLVVFVTKSSQYTIQGYEVAFRYLMKPVSDEAMEKVLKAAMEEILPQKIVIDINGTNLILSVKEIYYFEIYGHNVDIITKDRTYKCRNSLRSIEEMLNGCPFIRPHNSFLVNMEYIVGTSPTEISMKNGRKISLSRKKKDEVYKALHQYLKR